MRLRKYVSIINLLCFGERSVRGTPSASPDILTAAVFTWKVVIPGDVRSAAKLSKQVNIQGC